MVRPKGDYIHAIDVLRVSPEYLEQFLMEHSKHEKFISIDEVPERIRNHKRGDKPFAVVTFDDGYEDNYTYAYPILKKMQIPFVVYVAVNLVNDHTSIWNYPLIIERIIRKNDKLELGNGRTYICDTEKAKNMTFGQLKALLFSLPYNHLQDEFEKLFKNYLTEDVFPCNTLTWKQIKKMADDPLCTIGSHTMSHCRLTITDNESLSYELKQSRDILAQRVGRPINHLSYPYGAKTDVSEEAKQFARELGYTTALMSSGGPIRENDLEINMFNLKRMPVYE